MFAALLFALNAVVPDRVLIVTATAGFRHSSIATAEAVMARLAPRVGFAVEYARTEEEMAAALTPENLARFKVVMFTNTTGNLNASSDALLDWIRNGGSFVGAHSASDTWHERPAYIEMLGGEFDHHPDQTFATLFVDDANHPATAGLDGPHVLFEEYYLLKSFEASRVHLLISLRASPESGEAGIFPLAWYRDYGKGRVFYTALGHREDVWESEWFQQHLAGAMVWALRRDEVPRRRAVRSR